MYNWIESLAGGLIILRNVDTTLLPHRFEAVTDYFPDLSPQVNTSYYTGRGTGGDDGLYHNDGLTGYVGGVLLAFYGVRKDPFESNRGPGTTTTPNITMTLRIDVRSSNGRIAALAASEELTVGGATGRRYVRITDDNECDLIAQALMLRPVGP